MNESPLVAFGGDLTKDEVSELLSRWCFCAVRPRIQSFAKFSKTIRTHKDGIMASIELGISNGRAEGVECKGLFHYRQMLWASFRRGDTGTGDAFLWTDLAQTSV